MALPPTIPTSFVPHPSSSLERRFRSDFTGASVMVGYGALFLAILLAIGVAMYGYILSGTLADRDAQLARAEAAIDPATVEAFVRLRDRLTTSSTLLDSHIALSGFFSTLERILPTTVRFTTLNISVNQANAIRLEGAGTAKSFNALAAASGAFAKDGRIKDAIFSNIGVNRDTSVSFSFSATLDPRLTAFTPTALPPSSVSATTSATTTSP